MNGAADELSLACGFITAPEDDDDVPAELRGRPAVVILGMWAGSVADGERALEPIRALGPDADFFGATPYADFQCSVDDPPGYRNYWTAENVVDLPDAAIDAIVQGARGLQPRAVAAVHRCLGRRGAPVRPRALATRRPRSAVHRPSAAAVGGPG
jgi:hypothetical protein